MYSVVSVVLVVAVCLSCVLFCPALAAESKWKISFQNIFCHLRNNNFVCFLFFLYYSLAGQCYCLSHSVYVCMCVCVWKSFVVCPIWFLYIHCCCCWGHRRNEFFFPVDVFNGVCFYNLPNGTHTHTHVHRQTYTYTHIHRQTYCLPHTYANFDVSTGFIFTAFSVINSVAVFVARCNIVCPTLLAFSPRLPLSLALWRPTRKMI